MSSEWRWERLGDYCTKIGSGATPRGGKDVYLEQGPIALIRSQNVYNDGFISEGLVYINEAQAQKLDNVELHQDDILLNITGDSVARVCMVNKNYLPARVNQHVSIIRPNPSVFDARFVRYFLASPYQQELMHSLASAGATRNALTKGMIEDFEVPCPPVAEQQSIADILSALDDRIALLRETNATLESIAQAIFKSWFIDFDPVKARQRGEKPQGMDAATAALFPDAFQDSELGPIPAGWKWSTIGESFVLTMGQSPPGEAYNEHGEGLPFYQGRSDFGFRFPSRRVFCTSPTRIVEAGDTMVSVRAPVGDVNRAIEKCCLGRGVAGVQHQTGKQSFAFYVIKNLRQHFDHYNGVGTVFGAINKKDFNALTVIKPLKEVVSVFEDIVSSFDEQIAKNEKQSQTLASIRDALLPRLISGRLRLPEAEAMAEDAGR